METLSVILLFALVGCIQALPRVNEHSTSDELPDYSRENASVVLPQARSSWAVTIASSGVFGAEVANKMTGNKVFGPFTGIVTCINVFCTPASTANTIAWILEKTMKPVTTGMYTSVHTFNDYFFRALGNVPVPGLKPAVTAIRTMLTPLEETLERLKDGTDTATKKIKAFQKVSGPIANRCAAVKGGILVVHLQALKEEAEHGTNYLKQMEDPIDKATETCVDIVNVYYAPLGWAQTVVARTLDVEAQSHIQPTMDMVLNALEEAVGILDPMYKNMKWLNGFSTIINKVIDTKVCFGPGAYNPLFAATFGVAYATGDGIFNAAKCLSRGDVTGAVDELKSIGVSLGKTMGQLWNDVKETWNDVEDVASDVGNKVKEFFGGFGRRKRSLYSNWSPFLDENSAKAMLTPRKVQFTGEMVAGLSDFMQDGKVCVSIRDIIRTSGKAVDTLLKPLVGELEKELKKLMGNIQKHIPGLRDIPQLDDVFEDLDKLTKAKLPGITKVNSIVNIIGNNPVFSTLLSGAVITPDCNAAIASYTDAHDADENDFLASCLEICGGCQIPTVTQQNACLKKVKQTYKYVCLKNGRGLDTDLRARGWSFKLPSIKLPSLNLPTCTGTRTVTRKTCCEGFILANGVCKGD